MLSAFQISMHYQEFCHSHIYSIFLSSRYVRYCLNSICSIFMEQQDMRKPPSATRELRTTKYESQDTDAECGIRNTEYEIRVQKSGCGTRDAGAEHGAWGAWLTTWRTALRRTLPFRKVRNMGRLADNPTCTGYRACGRNRSVEAMAEYDGPPHRSPWRSKAHPCSRNRNSN